MKEMRSKSLWSVLVILSVALAAGDLLAQGYGRGRGKGRGPGPHGPGAGRGPGHDERHEEDHAVFKFLLANHEKITRKVTQLPDGVETLTESQDPAVAAKIKEHVRWMQHRVENAQPIRMRDPLFAELFQHTDKIKMVREETKHGVRVRETSKDPYVVKLIQAHGEAVSGFVQRGFAEAMKNHAAPGKPVAAPAKPRSPKIAKYGQVVRLPDAPQQPRDGSRIVVDLTRGGDPAKLNPGVEKVARFVNIYSSAGKQAATARIAVVLHGDAMLTVLNDDAYAKRFGVKGNPNLDCLHELHEAGVELLVCGQSLTSKGGKPEEVVVFADTAVSGLTALVNLQADGYAYMPLLSN